MTINGCIKLEICCRTFNNLIDEQSKQSRQSKQLKIKDREMKLFTDIEEFQIVKHGNGRFYINKRRGKKIFGFTFFEKWSVGYYRYDTEAEAFQRIADMRSVIEQRKAEKLKEEWEEAHCKILDCVRFEDDTY